jgi:hypothetical protein
MVPTYCISGTRFIADQVLKWEGLEKMMEALKERGSEVTIVCESGEPSL